MNEEEVIHRLDRLGDVLERPPVGPNDEIVFDDLPGVEPFKIQATDAFSAEHYHVLCHEMTPAASIFLEPRGMMGGQISNRVWMEMKAAGYEPNTSSIMADHLSNLFRFYAFVLRNEQPEVVSLSIQQNVLSWLPIFLDVLSRQQSPLISPLGKWIEQTILQLHPDSAPKITSTPDLVPLHFSLADERTGLVAISIFLSTHAESGLFIPKSRLADVARKNRLPTGFGSRSQTIEGLLRSASGYDSLQAVCDFFLDEVGRHSKVWEQWNLKGAKVWADRWTEKLNHTATVIESIRTAS